MDKEVCGTCKYRQRVYDGHCHAEFCCRNEDSDNYAVPVFNDDWREEE